MPIDYVVDDHIATITLNRPEALNSIDLQMWRDFGEATHRFENDDSAWIGIVTGAGERAFCAGADITTTIRQMLDNPRSGDFEPPVTIMRGQSITKPLIAAVNGIAFGGGLEIALACDFRIASTNARFAAPEVKLA